MPTTTQTFASGTPTTTGSTWTNATNATGTNNAGFATYTTATSAAVGTILLNGFGQSSSGMDSVTSVAVTVWQNVATVARWSTVTATLQNGSGTAIGSAQSLTLSATSSNSQTLTFTGVSVANVTSGLQVLLSATKSGTQSSTFNVDAVGVSITYAASARSDTPALSGSGTLSASGSATSGGAPTYVSSSSGGVAPGATTTATVTVNAPTGIVSGNALVAIVANSKANGTGDTYASFAPSGWTKQDEYVTSTTDGMIAVYTKTATGSEPSTYAFGYTCTTAQTQYVTAAVLQYTGAFDRVSHAGAGGTAGTTYTAPSITTTQNYGVYIAGWVNKAGTAITAPGTMTTRESPLSSGNYSLDVADKSYTTAGSSGTFGATGSSDTWSAVTLSIVPQPTAFSASPALSGSGTLVVTAGTPGPKQAPALTGSGSLTASATSAIPGTAALSGSGALTVPGLTPQIPVAPQLAGSGTLTGSTTPRPATSPQATGSGTLAASGVTTLVTTTALGADAQVENPAVASGTLITLPYSQPFALSNGAAIPSELTVGSPSGASFSIQGGSLVATTTHAYDDALVSIAGIPPTTDLDVRYTGSVTWSDGNDWPALITSFLMTNSVEQDLTFDQSGLALSVNSARRFTDASTVLQSGVPFTLRLRRFNGIWSGKVWQASQSEPSSWAGSYTEPSPVPISWFRLDGYNDSPSTFTFDDIAVFDPSKIALSGSGSLAASGLADGIKFNFEDDTAQGWFSGSSWTTAVVSSPARNSWALQATRNTTTSGNGYLSRGNLAVNPSTAYRLTVWTYASAATPYVISIAPKDGSGSATGFSRIEYQFTPTANTWQQQTFDFTVPSGAAFVETYIADDNNGSPTNGSTLAIDDYLLAVNDSAFSASPALSGSGTLTVPTVTPSLPSAPQFTGSGTLTAAPAPAVSLAIPLTGSGSLASPTATPAIPTTPQFTGSGALQTGTSVAATASLAFSGSGTVTVPQQTPAPAVTTPLSGSGALTTSAAIPAAIVSLQLAGSGVLTLTAAPNAPGTASLSGAGSLSTSAIPAIPAAITLTGAGTLATARTVATAASIALSGTGSLGSAGTLAYTTTTSLGTGASLSATASTEVATTTAISAATVLFTIEALPFYEPFNGSNGAPWAGYWAPYSGSTSTVDINANRGRIVLGDEFGGHVDFVPSDRIDTTFTLDLSGLASEADPSAYFFFDIALSRNNGAGDLFWELYWEPSLSSGNTLDISAHTRGSGYAYTNGSTPAFTLGLAQPLKVRVVQDGTTSAIKIWAAGSAEPNDFLNSTTATASVTGRYFLDLYASDYFPSGPVSIYLDEVTAGQDPVSILATTTPLGVNAGISSPSEIRANVDLAGTGTLSPAATPSLPAAPQFSGSGAIAATPAPPNFLATIPLAGSGTLSTTATPSTAVSPQLSGSGTLAVSTTANPTAGPSLTGSGALQVTVTGAVSGVAAFSGAGVITVPTATPAVAVTVAATGSGTLGAPFSSALTASTQFTGAGNLSTTAAPSIAAPVALSGSGALSAVTAPTFTTTSSLASNAALSATTSTSATTAPTFSGGGTLTLAATLDVPAAVALTGIGGLALSANPAAPGIAVLSGAGALAVTPAPTVASTVTFSGAGSLTRSSVPGVPASPAFTGSGTVTAETSLGTLVFSDDFTGTTLSSNWAANWFGGTSYNGTTVLASNVTIANGYASLQVDSSGNGALLTTNPHNGNVTTPFEFGVGYYVEARIFLPGTGGVISNWPAFWTDGQNWPQNGETDIVEASNSDGSAGSNYHSGPTGTDTPNNYTVPGTWTGGWHTYALRRLPGVNEIYWDGAFVRSYTTNDGGSPHYLILDNVASTSRGFVSGSSGAMLVDYVKVWQLPISSGRLAGDGALTTAATRITTTGTATLSGSGSLAALTSPTFTSTSTLTANAALTCTASSDSQSGATLSGSGSLGVVALTSLASTSHLGVNADLSAISAVVGSSTVPLTGSGSLTGIAVPAPTAFPSLSGSGTLSASSATPAVQVTVALTGTGALAPNVTTAVAATVPLTGSGTLTASTATARSATISLGGSGTLAVVATPAAQASTALSGLGALATVSTSTAAQNVALTGSGGLTLAATPKVTAAVAFSGSGTLASSATSTVATGTNLAATAILTATASNSALTATTSSLSAAATLTATATTEVATTSQVRVTATLTAATSTAVATTADLTVSAALTATATALTSLGVQVGLSAAVLTEYVNAVTLAADVAVAVTQSSVVVTTTSLTARVAFTAIPATTIEVGVGVGTGGTDTGRIFRDLQFAILDMYGNPLRVGAELPGAVVYAWEEPQEIAASIPGRQVSIRGNPLKVNGSF